MVLFNGTDQIFISDYKTTEVETKNQKFEHRILETEKREWVTYHQQTNID